MWIKYNYIVVLFSHKRRERKQNREERRREGREEQEVKWEIEYACMLVGTFVIQSLSGVGGRADAGAGRKKKQMKRARKRKSNCFIFSCCFSCASMQVEQSNWCSLASSSFCCCWLDKRSIHTRIDIGCVHVCMYEWRAQSGDKDEAKLCLCLYVPLLPSHPTAIDGLCLYNAAVLNHHLAWFYSCTTFESRKVSP